MGLKLAMVTFLSFSVKLQGKGASWLAVLNFFQLVRFSEVYLVPLLLGRQTAILKKPASSQTGAFGLNNEECSS